MAFVSSNSTNSNCNSNTNEADNIAYGVSAAHTQCLEWSAINVIKMVTLQENEELLEIKKTEEERIVEEP
ncbi:hypothetical protein Tco_0042220 [Tanacetum coccineum]